MIEDPGILGKNLFFEGGNSMKINFLLKNGYKGIDFGTLIDANRH